MNENSMATLMVQLLPKDDWIAQCEKNITDLELRDFTNTPMTMKLVTRQINIWREQISKLKTSDE